MRWPTRIRRAFQAVLAAVWLVAPAGWSTLRVAAEPLDLGRPPATDAPRSPFRLGTAGRPFVWSTAVGDLNADGRPDVAVADRIGRGGAGFEYSVELSITGRAPQSITFDSMDAALSVSLRDVDHDQDLDLVVSTVVSPSVVRVWLNDGRGAFAETAARTPDAVWSAALPTATGDGPGRSHDAESAPRRADDSATAAVADPARIVPPSFLAIVTSAARTDSPGPSLPPRAPPASAARLL